MSRTSRFAVLLAVPVLVCACGQADSAGGSAEDTSAASASSASASEPQVVEVGAVDYSFESPDELDPGWVTFHLANHGAEAHHLTLLRLEEGRTVTELVAALRDGRPIDGIATWAGGPNAPMPGASSNATVQLTPGEYALICLVPSPDGVPHVFKGMVKEITVRDGPSAGAEPAADVEVTLRDYAFQMNREVTAGKHTIRAVNETTSTEPHEVVVARLAPGKTVQDVNNWIHDMQGPPPAEFLGGISAIAPGQSGTFTVDFTPGEYAILCPVPGADGEPHTYKGMMLQFTVM